LFRLNLHTLFPLRLWFGPDRKMYRALRNMIGFMPGNIHVYKLAFSHRSSLQPNANTTQMSNERLEYLGDAVLGAVVAEMLFRRFPYRDEGFLTEMRSRIVSRENLKNLAMKLGIDKFVINNSGPGMHRSMYGDAFEALVGAIFIDKGFDCARIFVLHRIVNIHLDLDVIEKSDNNYKSRIINWAQREKRKLVFEMVNDGSQGRLIKVQLMLDDELLTEGEDFSRKKAEQIAAGRALEKLGLED
jgi:ribonuclease-3